MFAWDICLGSPWCSWLLKSDLRRLCIVEKHGEGREARTLPPLYSVQNKYTIYVTINLACRCVFVPSVYVCSYSERYCCFLNQLNYTKNSIHFCFTIAKKNSDFKSNMFTKRGTLSALKDTSKDIPKLSKFYIGFRIYGYSLFWYYFNSVYLNLASAPGRTSSWRTSPKRIPGSSSR